MIRIKVNVPNSYEVLIGKGIVSELNKEILTLNIKGKIAIITDERVGKIYLEKVTEILRKDFEVYSFVVEGGEKSKSGKDFLSICEFLAENNFTRSDSVLALGGGVVGDLTGFVASAFLRGINYLQLPTSLLSFVDSSVGGKTAINLEYGKNLVGAFYQPRLVLIDCDFASTLPKKEYACGMAEVIKTGMIFDREMLDLLKDGMDKHFEKIVASCVFHKKSVVEQDEHDNGLRQLLNFGHTLGHAIEKESGFTISHGEAVAIGMYLVAKKCVENGLVNSEILTLLEELLAKYDLPKSTKICIDELLNKSLIDKKRKGNSITLVIPTALGKCELKKMTIDEYKEFVLN